MQLEKLRRWTFGTSPQMQSSKSELFGIDKSIVLGSLENIQYSTLHIANLLESPSQQLGMDLCSHIRYCRVCRHVSLTTCECGLSNLIQCIPNVFWVSCLLSTCAFSSLQCMSPYTTQTHYVIFHWEVGWINGQYLASRGEYTTVADVCMCVCVCVCVFV